jgi:predicted PurR-regulated permease PerM
MSAQQTFRNTLVVIGTIVAAYALYVSVHILIVLLIAIIVASAIRPLVLWLERHRIPQGLAILFVYGGLAIIIFVLVALVFPPAVTQLAGYIQNDQGLASRLIGAQTWFQQQIKLHFNTDVQTLDPEAIRTTVSQTVDQITASIPALAGEFGGLLGDFVLVFVMGVYWVTSRDQAVDFILSLFSIGRRALVAQIIEEIEQTLGSYLRGITFVVTFVGVANFVILTILGVPNAVTLGFIIGITTALPIIGGFIGAGTAVLLALLTSPVAALLTLASFVAVQQVETHWLTPRTMSKSVGLNPLLVIVFLFVGIAVGGVVGGIISVPIAGAVFILLRHLVIEPRKEENAPQRVRGGILISSDNNSLVETGGHEVSTP